MQENSNSLITLTTDFGHLDEYAGIMKGVILTHAPLATIIDITHGIESQNVKQAAYCIYASYRYFPINSVHVIVVDPGVGSNRRIILIKSNGHFFLAPDNGILTLLLEKKLFEDAFEVTCDDLFLKPLSKTFHGRDIMAPVAARLTRGLPPASVGKRLDRSDLCTLPRLKPEADRIRAIIRGEVISIDRFGNLITNITYDDVQKTFENEIELTLLTSINGHDISGINTTYSSVSDGELLVIIGSRNSLEIAANKGSAALIIKAAHGDEVTVSRRNK